jgi:hypothetical protein
VDNPKYKALVRWAFAEFKYPYNSSILGPVVDSFLDNLARIRSLALMPAVMVAHASGKGDRPEGLASGTVDAEDYIGSIPVVGGGFKPFFSSIVSGAWTTFEALATDLWIASVNARGSLAERAMKTKRNRTSDDAGDDDEVNTSKQKANPAVVRVDLLAKYKFDLKNRIGHIVWREERLRFNTLGDLQHTYRAAFGPQAKEWFGEPPYKELAHLEAMRQVIVHRGGKVDEYFVERVTQHPILSNLTPGDPLPLDGQVAAEMAELAWKCGCTLLDHVDEWLEDNVR